jgi:hypothetical protein
MTDRGAEALAVVMLVTCLTGAGVTARAISREREDLQLVVSAEGTQGMPPHVAIATAALGTFRGLAVDVLWARADALQTKGEFFEAQTLAQWITALQPRFPRVWAFQAWNLAYNISVATTAPAERWGWITRAIGLLRDRGMPLNPTDANLPSELAWIYFHKIGGKLDREHWYYKARLAREFRELLGDPSGGRTSAEAIARFRAIVEAADTPEHLRADRAAAGALDRLAGLGHEPDEAFVRMLGRVVLYTGSVDAKLRIGRTIPRGTDRDLIAALREDPEFARAVFDAIVPHVQKRVLLDRYRMDPAFMLAQMERFGPLDWAHPHAHGIYWSERAIALGEQTLRRDRLNELTIIRHRLSNLQDLMRSGRVEFDPLADRIDILPDPRFIEGYERGIRDALVQIRSEQGLSAAEFGRATESDLLTGYESFLHQAVVFSYLYGDEAQAAGCFGKLREIAEDSGRGSQPMYSEGLEGFLAVRLGEVMEIDLSNTRQFLDAMIQRAMADGLAKGRLDTFNRFVKLAYSVYDRRYAASAPGTVHVSKEGALPPFPELVSASFESAMKQESTPVLVRARIWAWAPESLRNRSWARIGPTLVTHAEAVGLDPARAFPVPPEAEASPPAEPEHAEPQKAMRDRAAAATPS